MHDHWFARPKYQDRFNDGVSSNVIFARLEAFIRCSRNLRAAIWPWAIKVGGSAFAFSKRPHSSEIGNAAPRKKRLPPDNARAAALRVKVLRLKF